MLYDQRRPEPTSTLREALYEESPTALFWVDEGGTVLDCNQSFLDLIQVPDPSNALEGPMSRWCADPVAWTEALRHARIDVSVTDVELAIRAATGRTLQSLLSLRRVRDEGWRGFVGALRDVTGWSSELHSIREEAERFRTIVMSMAEGAVLVDEHAQILACNASAERILGLTRDEMLGRSADDPRWEPIREDGSPFPADQHPVSLALRTGVTCSNVVMGVHKPDGLLNWISINSTPLFRKDQERPYAVTATFADITAHRALEAQLLQSQKLDALGQLAGGIAHDFNNMLTVVFNRSELLMRTLREEPQRRFASDILAAARQSADLTQQLLGAARKQILQPRVVDFGPLIREAMELFLRSIGERITVRMELDESAWRVFADPGKLRQVLLNLVINARDAMPTGGVLVIQVRNFVADRAYVRKHPNVQHGEYVTLTVCDTGCGIPLELQQKIYDPFFTTKPVGKGSGLGLAVVRGIVEQTGGHITVYSESGRGTTFKVYLPRFEGDVEELAAAAIHELPFGSETVLLVEDDDLVRNVLAEALEEQGYKVLRANNGNSALETAAHHRGTIDLLLTDVMMPGVPGPELATRLAATHPHLRIILMSGYNENAVAEDFGKEHPFSFLEKPVMAGPLLNRVREVLDA